MEQDKKGKSIVSPSEESTKRKRKNKWQIDILEYAYTDVTERPSTELKMELAEITGLTVNQVQFWFSNKRGSKTRYGPKLKPGQEPGQTSGASSVPQEQPKRYPAPAEAQHFNWRPPLGPFISSRSGEETDRRASDVPQEQDKEYPVLAVPPIRLGPLNPFNQQGQLRHYAGPAGQHNKPSCGQETGQTVSNPQERLRRYAGPAGRHSKPSCGQESGQTSSDPQEQLRRYAGPTGQHNDWRAPVGKVEVILPPLFENERPVRNGATFRYLSKEEYQRLIQITPTEISEHQQDQETVQNSQGNDELAVAPKERSSEKPVICYQRKKRQNANLVLVDLNEAYIEPGMPSSSSQEDQHQENPSTQTLFETSISVPPGFEELYKNDVNFRRARAKRLIRRSHERH